MISEERAPRVSWVARWGRSVACTALALLPVLVLAGESRAADPVGFLDIITTDFLAHGWALDMDDPTLSITVHFYIDSVYVDAAVTTVNRPDVNSARSVTGNHGYSWSIPLEFLDGSTHALDVIAINVSSGSDTVLMNSGMTFAYTGGPIYSSHVDRFELTGPSITNFVEEFDDGVITGWDIQGTAIESEGLIELRHPGNRTEYLHPNGFSFIGEGTVAKCTGCPAIADGSGDFTSISIWKNQTFPDDNFVIHGLTFFEGATQRGIGVTIQRYGPSMSPIYGVTGLSTALSTAELTFTPSVPLLMTLDQLEIEFVPLGGVPSDFAFRLDYDDTTNTFTAAYSLDGGSNFTSFSNSYTAEVGWTGARFSLQVDPREATAIVPGLSEGGLVLLAISLLFASLWLLRSDQPNFVRT